MWCCYKDGITTDSVHVDASTTLNIIQMDITILGNQIDNIILGASLKHKDADLNINLKIAENKLNSI